MGNVEKRVRDLIARYVAGIITLEQFDHGLPDGWDLDQISEPEARRLVLLVMGYLADYGRENLSASELRQLLGAEASWHLERASEAATPARPPDPVATQVHAGAGRELQAALA
jgi:hypothetical protein